MTVRNYNVVTLYVRPSPSTSSVSGIRTLERARQIFEEASERAERTMTPWSIPYPENYTPPDAVLVTLYSESGRLPDRITCEPIESVEFTAEG